MRRARARGSHAGVQRRSPDRVLSVGALGARKRTLQRPTSSHARAASLTPLVGRAGERIALEADGPYHFAANTLAPGGAMLARHRLLAARGWAVISVPGYVWKELEDAGRGAWLMQARLLRCSLVAAWLPVLCTPLAQGLRLVSTLHQYVWWEARFTVLCGRDEGRASTRGVLCRESVARARHRRALQHSRMVLRGLCPPSRSWLPRSRRSACLRMWSAQRKLPASRASGITARGNGCPSMMLVAALPCGVAVCILDS